MSKTAAPRAVPNHISVYLTEFLQFLDPEGRYEVPTVEVVNRTSVTWLGLCASTFFGADGVITRVASKISLQQGLLVDEAHLRSVIAHEVSHHIATCELTVGKAFGEAREATQTEGHHGAKWQEVADRVNASYGAGFITVLSDMTQRDFERREVYAFAMADPGAGELHWCWSLSVPQALVSYMLGMRRAAPGQYNFFIGKTTSKWLVVPKAKSPKWAEVVYTEEGKALAELAKTQTNLFADYASGVLTPKPHTSKRWTLVMVDPHVTHPDLPDAEPKWINAWGIQRSLDAKDLMLLEQLNRWHRNKTMLITNDDNLLKQLPKFDRNAISSSTGIGGMTVYQPDVQDALRGYWSRAKSTAKVASAGIIYLDMDGVLADYNAAAEEAGVHPADFHGMPGSFRNLPLMPGALEAVEKLLELHGDRVHICSTPSKDRFDEAKKEKEEWLSENIPQLLDRAHFLADKSEIGGPDDYLVDDHPDWNGADKFKGTVIHFKGPETWEEVMTTVKPSKVAASGWGADADRYNSREDAYRQNVVQRTLRQRFNELISTLTVQPNGQNMTLRQFLANNPLTSLLHSTDRSVLLMRNKLLSDLKASLTQSREFTPEQIKQFEAQYGASPIEWIEKKVVAKQAVLFQRKSTKRAALFVKQTRK